MSLTANVTLEPATADYVLSVFRDSHRQQCEYDPEAESDIELTFDSTISEWRQACDLAAWRPLSKALEDWFNIEIPKSEWKQLLEPAGEKRLRELCDDIARRAERVIVRPKNILGCSCETASAFLAVKELLSQAGADITGLRPHTPLAEFTRLYLGVFLTDIGKLYPGRLPLVSIRAPLYNGFMATAGLLGLAALICGLFGFQEAASYAALGFALVALALFPLSRLKPCAVEFGNLETFRDLARQLVGSADNTLK